MAQAVSQTGSGHVGFMVDKVALGQVFSEYFHTHHRPSFGSGTMRQAVADVPIGLSLAPPQENKKKIVL
jgi:hypothetical protein